MARRKFFAFTTLIVILMLLLVACELPSPSVGDVQELSGGETTSTDGGDQAAEDSTAGETAGEDATADDTAGEDTADDAGTTDETQDDAAAEDTAAEDGATDTEDESSPRPQDDAGAEEGSDEATDDGAAEDTASEDAASDDGAAEATDDAAAEEDGGDEAADDTADSGDAGDAAAETETGGATTHTVQPGENLYRIGLQYNVSWTTLAAFNGIVNPNALQAGQVLNIPAADSGSNTPDPAVTPTPTDETVYTVQPGDNLFLIGLQYGLDWTQIAEANGLVNPNFIQAGQQLKIPANQPGTAPEFTHIVAPGETLFLISLRYGVTWPSIAEQNEIEAPYVIYVGQPLVIPGGQ